MDTSPEKYIQRLNETVDKKLGLLQDILELTEEQASSISEDGLEGLQRLVDDKQEKIDAVDKLDEEFKVYFQRLKSVLKVDSLSELDASGIAGAKELKGKVAEILELIKEIADSEKGNNSAAKKLLDSLGSEVKKLNQGMQMNNAYTPGHMNTASYYIDKKK